MVSLHFQVLPWSKTGSHCSNPKRRACLWDNSSTISCMLEVCTGLQGPSFFHSVYVSPLALAVSGDVSKNHQGSSARCVIILQSILLIPRQDTKWCPWHADASPGWIHQAGPAGLQKNTKRKRAWWSNKQWVALFDLNCTSTPVSAHKSGLNNLVKSTPVCHVVARYF